MRASISNNYKSQKNENGKRMKKYRNKKLLAGIITFGMVITMSCGQNPLTSLDLSQNKKLTELQCSYTQVTSLDVSNMKNLTKLDCGFNQLTSLNASGDTALKELSCYQNSLTSLDISGCLALTELSCSQNPHFNYIRLIPDTRKALQKLIGCRPCQPAWIDVEL